MQQIRLGGGSALVVLVCLNACAGRNRNDASGYDAGRTGTDAGDAPSTSDDGGDPPIPGEDSGPGPVRLRSGLPSFPRAHSSTSVRRSS